MRITSKAARIAVLAVLLALAAYAAAGNHDLDVCESGCAYTSIAAALEAAVEGDTVLVRAGTYREGPLVIDKQLSLVGEDWPVLDGELEHQILTIEADFTVVRGLVLSTLARGTVPSWYHIQPNDSERNHVRTT